MITAVLTAEPVIAETFIRKLGLEKFPQASGLEEAIYRKGKFVLAVSQNPKAVSDIRAEYLPERLYYAAFWTSATSERFTGDVVLPNAFIPYGDLEETEQAAFLENYEEQEDYDFETFGLSVGGICVSTEKELDDETLVNIASEYGADIVDKHASVIVSTAEEDGDFLIYPIYGVIDGIVGNEGENISEESVAKNLFAVFQYLEDTFSDETETETETEEPLTDDKNDEQA